MFVAATRRTSPTYCPAQAAPPVAAAVARPQSLVNIASLVDGLRCMQGIEAAAPWKMSSFDAAVDAEAAATHSLCVPHHS